MVSDKVGKFLLRLNSVDRGPWGRESAWGIRGNVQRENDLPTSDVSSVPSCQLWWRTGLAVLLLKYHGVVSRPVHRQHSHRFASPFSEM